MLKQTDIKKLELKLKSYLVRDELVKGSCLKSLSLRAQVLAARL